MGCNTTWYGLCTEIGLSFQGNLIWNFDLLHHLRVPFFLDLGSCFFHDFLLLNRSDHLPLFLFKLFALLDTLDFAFFDLLDDDWGTTALSFSSELLTLILCLESLQALDFHHDIEAFLFCEPFLLQLLVFFELFVSDGHDFGVEGHLIHKLYIVVFLIHRGLGSGEQSFGALILFNLDLSGRQFLRPSCVHWLHLLLSGFGKLLLLSFLFLCDLVLLLQLLGADDYSALSDASDLSLTHDSTSTGPALTAFRLNITPQLSKLIVTNNRTVSGRWLCCRCYQKK